MKAKKAVTRGKPHHQRSLRVVSLKFVPTLGVQQRLARVYDTLLAHTFEESETTNGAKRVSQEGSDD